jgi:hypothetical protein
VLFNWGVIEHPGGMQVSKAHSNLGLGCCCFRKFMSVMGPVLPWGACVLCFVRSAPR